MPQVFSPIVKKERYKQLCMSFECHFSRCSYSILKAIAKGFTLHLIEQTVFYVRAKRSLAEITIPSMFV
jgi:hypothetical protein